MVFMDYTRMKDYIKTKGIKQKRLAERTGIPEAALCLILAGKRKCDTSEYAKICTELEVGLNEFITESEDPEAGIEPADEEPKEDESA